MLLVLALCAGCPGESDGPALGDGGPGAGGGEVDAGTCEVAERCAIAFSYPADGVSSVEVRGDFAPDGWQNGLLLERDGDFFRGSVEIDHGRAVQYKLVLDGATWVADPVNPDRVPDGQGGQNSLATADCDSCAAARHDWRDDVLYFVFVDRFRNGDPSNDAPLDGVDDEANYRGGDLAGVLDAIEEGTFDDLGVTALWLTAPYDNADGAGAGDDGHDYSAYHGYWPRDLGAVEPRVGTLDDLRAVVDAAHARGLRIFLDYVMNHVSLDSPVYAEHPDWFWPLHLDGGGTCTCGGDCGWAGADGRRCWFREYLPDFDFTRADARAWSVGNAVEWIEKTGIDGYRLDAVKHIETQWVIDLRAALAGKPFYMVGETFDGDRGLIGSYVDPTTMLDGQFDFPLRAQLVRNLLRREGHMGELSDFLAANDAAYHPRAVMGTFIGNHDLPRPIHIGEDAPMFSEWDSGRSRSWTDRPSLPDYDRPFQRLALVYAFLMTTHGMPLIYYGDELGLAGGGDPDNRRVMPWSNLTPHQTWLRDQLRALIRLRRDHESLRRGYRRTLHAAGDLLVYQMVGTTEILTIALNRGDAPATASLPAGPYRDLLRDEDVSTASVTIPPRGFRVLGRVPVE
ncbi:MAG TPA: alpha-amylase family glycosyl hydrolase [Kofleriaceae bacterium]|nr:alpha-amylase family glycosyl hydrolase [Kofleriaceae bacterium]